MSRERSKVSEIEKEYCIEKFHDHYEDCHYKEKVFYHLENKELEDDKLNYFHTCMQLNLEEVDEERESQDESPKVFITTWCLNSSDDDFLCGEDILIRPSLTVEDETFSDEIKGMIPSGQPCTYMSNGEATIGKILQTYSLS